MSKLIRKKLLLDLGGTNLRAGIGDAKDLSIIDVSKTKVSSNEEIFNVIKDYTKDENLNEIIFSAAGPRHDNVVSMTNRSLELDGNVIQNTFKVNRCDMLNDWESIGYCLPLLNQDDFILLKGGNREPKKTSIAIGPGTGLGVSILRHINQIPYVFATELGNTKSFNNYLNQQFQIQNTSDFKVLENYLSGTGIQKIYKSISGISLSSEQIVDAYNLDKTATFVIDNFCKCLGRVLADLNLTVMAVGGIYFAGALMRRMQKLGAVELLISEFNEHHSQHHRKILTDTSIHLITKEHTPLYGNLNYSIVRRLHE